MLKGSILTSIYRYATLQGLSPKLVAAIVLTESSGNVYAHRFEEHYKYLFQVEKHAKINSVTPKSEKNFQQTSLGLMQLMGANFRELGWSGPLPLCFDISINIKYGCKHLGNLNKRYKGHELDMVAAYNAGHAARKNGLYKNQQYVDKVLKNYRAVS
jgi:soluble lytic murein transglycosylase-like protein